MTYGRMALSGLTLMATAASTAVWGEIGVGRSGIAVYGVDSLGRWAVALDESPTDGLIERWWVMESDGYVKGPWFKTAPVNIMESDIRLTIYTDDRSDLVGLSVKAAGKMEQRFAPIFDNLITDQEGTHFVKYVGPLDGSEYSNAERAAVETESPHWHISEFDPYNLDHWPFHIEDAVYHKTFPAPGCDVGGPGVPHCAISCTGGGSGQTSCVVPKTCHEPQFACCWCDGGPNIAPAKCDCLAEAQ